MNYDHRRPPRQVRQSHRFAIPRATRLQILARTRGEVMYSIQDLKLDFFLPLVRLKELENSAQISYNLRSRFLASYSTTFSTHRCWSKCWPSCRSPGKFPGIRSIAKSRSSWRRPPQRHSVRQRRLLFYHLNYITFFDFASHLPEYAI